AILDAAETLFYDRGFHAVGVDEIRAAAGVTLKRIYAHFPTKQALAVAMLDRRDERWRDSVESHVSRSHTRTQRLAALFEWLGEWFAQPEFRGCAWINAHGEMAAASPAILAAVRTHKRRFREQIIRWCDGDESLADSVYLLAEGAMVTAGIHADPDVARSARAAAVAVAGTG
ncbi:MAG: helix-turn-helix domain-containing protein, partial [Gordonia sp. (in: high G+C Gram-positive bacteria)]